MNTPRTLRRVPRPIQAVAERVSAIALLLLGLSALALVGLPGISQASSHREAPFISQDPLADNTDVYAFVSPDVTNTVTLVGDWIPLQQPAAGPNFYKFDDNVLYEIKIDNNGNGEPDVVYQFRFNTVVSPTNTFLYNGGPITSLDDPNWFVKQFYTVTRIEGGNSVVLGSGLKTPPVNVGPRSTPNYAALSAMAVQTVGNRKFFAGQRDDPFYVDLGSIFDLGGLRPFNSLHILPLPDGPGIDGVGGYNVHSIILQVPQTDLTANHQPPGNGNSGIVGVWATSSRPATRVLRPDGTYTETGNFVQISRLGNPLINEVIIPRGKKDYWNASKPSGDKQFLPFYRTPELTGLENLLYPALDNANQTGRDDLVGVLLTGLPNFNFTGNTKADQIRLNMTIPVAANPNRLGPLDGANPDLQGFPNGRRLVDDVVDIELRATAEGYGAALNSLYGVPNRTPNNLLGDGVDTNDKAFQPNFPYVANPWSGYEATPPTP